MQIDQLSKRVAEKLSISPDLVEEVYRSQFKFLLEHFKNRELKAVNCIHLGKFIKNKNYDNDGNSLIGERLAKLKIKNEI